MAYPTESVWGLGCDPDNLNAVTHLLNLKHRSLSKGLILLAAHIDTLRPYLAGLDAAQIATMQASWPGPVTWLVPNNGTAPHWISGGQNTLAVRVSAHPVAAALSHALGRPIVSTSANPQGLAPALSLTRVKVYFGDKVDDYTPGSVSKAAKPTEIRDLMSGSIVRSA